jgi:hypothetical protein
LYWATGSFKQWQTIVINRFYFVATSKCLIQKKDGELEIKVTVKKRGGNRTEVCERLRNHSSDDRNKYTIRNVAFFQSTR